MHLHFAFNLCARTAWPEAQERILQVKKSVAELRRPVPENLNLLIFYLQGIIHQGTGNLSAALEIFQHPSLTLTTAANNNAAPPPSSLLHHELAILSTLNMLLIIRSPTHPSNDQVPNLSSSIESLLLAYPITSNKSLNAAVHLVLATAGQDSGIVRTKHFLQSALQASKQAANNQLMCMTLHFMWWKYFRGVVNDQAEKSARASQHLARKSMDQLWTSVAGGVMGDTLEVMGRTTEAENSRREGREIAESLPGGIWRTM